MAPISKNSEKAEGKDSSSTPNRRKKCAPRKIAHGPRQGEEQEVASTSDQPQPASTSASTNFDYQRRHNPLLSRINVLPSYFQNQTHMPKGSAKRLQEVIAAFEVEREDNPYSKSGEFILDDTGIEKWATIKRKADKVYGFYKARIEAEVRDVVPSVTFAVSEDDPRVTLQPMNFASFSEYDTSRDENDIGDSVASDMEETEIVDESSAIEDNMGTNESDEDAMKKNEVPTNEPRTHTFMSLLLPLDLPAHLNAVRPMEPNYN